MKKLTLILSLIYCSLAFSASQRPLPTVDYVDVNKYMGKWYAVTALPQIFTRGCLYQMAEYDIIDTQSITVKNTCQKSNKKKIIRGTAVVDVAETNADLTVHFRLFWGLFPIQGDYKILALDDDYQYVMVGGENRKSLWIMSRTKSIPTDVLESYKSLASDLGFNTSALQDARF